MPTWNEILESIRTHNPHDVLRNDLLKKISKHTGRNVMVYYSGWLQKPKVGANYSISDEDKNGFMACCPKKEARKRGLDLILHTPGGRVDATESLIDYLYELYEGNIRAFVPQLAMSGGTLIAVSCKEIWMGNQSSIGPVDPQINGVAAQSYIAEFEKACEEVEKRPGTFPMWQAIVGKLPPGFLIECQNAIDWSNDILTKSLQRGMLAGDKDAAEKIKKIQKLLGDKDFSKTHARHITRRQAMDYGLNVQSLESDDKLQDLVLSSHHLLCLTFEQTTAVKIFANDKGSAYITHGVPAPANQP